jgi:hypothetical protein
MTKSKRGVPQQTVRNERPMEPEPAPELKTVVKTMQYLGGGIRRRSVCKRRGRQRARDP